MAMNIRRFFTRSAVQAAPIKVVAAQPARPPTPPTAPLHPDDLTQVAEQVSLLMQLDRTRHHVSTEVDMEALANVPDYIASVFEQAGAIAPGVSNDDLYREVNKRVAQVQAQIYLMRLEMENRSERDPAQVYSDPLAIAAYGERLETLTRRTKSFGFDSAVLAYGWYPTERSNGTSHRWMRPGDVSVACLPHLGTVDQIIEIRGHVLEAAQLETLVIRAGTTQAVITPEPQNPAQFTAQLVLSAEAVKSANHLPVEFVMSDFRQPNAQDTRMLGANISMFTCRPEPTDLPAPAPTAST